MDTFTGKDLKQCSNFELPQMCQLEIHNYNIGESDEADRADGWMGNYVEIGLNNHSRIYCDISDFGMIEEMKVDLVADKYRTRAIINRGYYYFF